MASSAAAPSASAAACTMSDITQIPTEDISCAAGAITGLASNVTDVLSDCCKSAPVNKYANDCAAYCLSVDQSISELRNCFLSSGVNAGTIFCRGNDTQTASGTPSETGSGAKQTQGGGEQTGAASVVNVPVQGVSKAGLGMLAVLGLSVVFGALL